MIKVERSPAAPDLLLWNQKRKMEVTGNKMLLSSWQMIFMRSVIFARSNLCRIPRLNTDWNQVKVKVKDLTDREALLTAELIEDVFNSTSTGIRTKAGQVRLRELQVVMNTLYKQLERYRQDPNDSRTIKTICGLLDRTAKFSGFARSYVREHKWKDLIRLADE